MPLLQPFRNTVRRISVELFWRNRTTISYISSLLHHRRRKYSLIDANGKPTWRWFSEYMVLLFFFLHQNHHFPILLCYPFQVKSIYLYQIGCLQLVFYFSSTYYVFRLPDIRRFAQFWCLHSFHQSSTLLVDLLP